MKRQDRSRQVAGPLYGKQYYFGFRQYMSAGLSPLLEHVGEYLRGLRTVPVTKTQSFAGKVVYFTFCDDVHLLFLTDVDKMKKPYECALKYGFLGFSAGGRNGIFLLRKQDSGLEAAVSKLARKHASEIVRDLDCGAEEIPSLDMVKIVHHAPSGERMVGVMNRKNHRIIFLGFGHY